MSFHHPLAWIGLLTIAIPIAIHLLVRAPAQPILLASLRFVPRSRLRALRRRWLSDGRLLLVRMAALAVAVGALADPLVATGCRQRTWNARLARVFVVEPGAEDAAAAEARTSPTAFLTESIVTPDLRQGIARAVAWLDAAPPARREIVVVGALLTGSLDPGALRDVPHGVGLRFLRAGTPPRPAENRPTVARGSTSGLTLVRDRVTAEGPVTRSSVVAVGPLPLEVLDTPAGFRVPGLALDVIAPKDARRVLRAALTASLTVGAPWPGGVGERPLLLVLDDAPGPAAGRLSPAPLSQPWMSSIAAAILDDREIAREARTATPVPGVIGDPWIAVARTQTGDVAILAAAAARGSSAAGPAGRSLGPAFVVLARAEAVSPLWPLLVHRLLSARVDAGAFAEPEVVPIAAATLEAWRRPAGAVDPRAPRGDAVSDRAWFWTAALAILAIEAWMRRRARTAHASHEESRDRAA